MKFLGFQIIVKRRPPPDDTPIQDDPYRELAADMIGPFENLLDEKKIVVPSEDREGNEDESCIFGSEYYNLEDELTQILKDRTVVV
jgi:hypothetical protein